MGDPFLRAYYSIYDLELKRIGLVGVADTKWQSDGDDEDEALVWIALFGGICIFITFILCLLAYLRDRQVG